MNVRLSSATTLLLASLALTAMSTACADSARHDVKAKAISPFDTVSTNSLTTLPSTQIDGKPFDIAAQPGWKVVYFWSGDCPCVKACEDFTLRPLAAKYAGKVTFYAIVADGYDLARPMGELQAKIAADKLPYAVLLDCDHKTTKALDAQVTPEAFVLDPDNNIVFSGMSDDSRRYLGKTGKRGVTVSYLSIALAEALTGKRVTKPHTELEGCIVAW